MEVGWRLARPAWHHGYATEAARAALDVAFDRLEMAEIYSMTAVLNEPSQAVMRRLGLTELTRWDHPRIPGDSPLGPHVTYRLGRDGGSGIPQTAVVTGSRDDLRVSMGHRSG
jgi:RimJ/RimL family protein N-acetyltransferase